MRVAPRGNAPGVRALARSASWPGRCWVTRRGASAGHRADRRPGVHRHQDGRRLHRPLLGAVLDGRGRPGVGEDVRRRHRQPLRRFAGGHRVLRVRRRRVAAGAAVAAAGASREARVPEGPVGVSRIRVLLPGVWTFRRQDERRSGRRRQRRHNRETPEQRARAPARRRRGGGRRRRDKRTRKRSG